MTPNPFAGLLHSRKFWLLMLDTVLGLATYFISKYAPLAAPDVKFVFGLIQPVFVTVILSITIEDRALIAERSAVAVAGCAGNGTAVASGEK
jgi:hypothetical protein